MATKQQLDAGMSLIRGLTRSGVAAFNANCTGNGWDETAQVRADRQAGKTVQTEHAEPHQGEPG